MGTATNVQAWSTTPASNSGADSTIGTMADTSAPTLVDDWPRGIMASIAKFADDTGGALVAGGTATALTVSTGQALSSGHIANGLRLCVRTGSSATGAATIAVDGLTAVDIKTNAGAAISSGDWASGAILDLVYSSTASAFIAANIGGAASVNITGLTADTSPDHANDYVPTYDDSASGNKKVLLRYLAPSVRASFSAHKNGTDQSIATSSATKVTFGTEIFDVGSAFASSTWTPPAGTVFICAHLTCSSVTAQYPIYLRIYKNGSQYKYAHGTADTAQAASASVSIIDQANGTDYYEVYVSSTDGSYSVLGASYYSYFTGTMV